MKDDPSELPTRRLPSHPMRIFLDELITLLLQTLLEMWIMRYIL
ncbi:hypothetical protein [Caballeronia sp. EK]|nr:hypothetical protein [Caballeronia sp. EK]